MAKKKDHRPDATASGKKSGKKSGGKSGAKPAGAAEPGASVAEALQVPAGDIRLADISTERAGVGPTSKKRAAAAMADLGPRLMELQERLFAESTAGGRRSALLILQGMDTAGKDGVIDHVVGELNPGGLQLASFKRPTAEELEHDFLWRIEKQVPGAGRIGVFNRSQYEDVLVVRVHDIVPRAVWSRRYAAINAFERRLTRQGVAVVKCFLHVSRDVQAERLLARLDDPTKYWKYQPGDVDERGLWSSYQQAYTDALRRCSTVGAPWYVIPSDHKWYRNWAVAALLAEKLAELDPQYPPADFDIDAERRRIMES